MGERELTRKVSADFPHAPIGTPDPRSLRTPPLDHRWRESDDGDRSLPDFVTPLREIPLARRVPRRGLPQWLSETPQPLFLVDARRVVIFFNAGCEALTGWSAADVIGQTCAYASDADWTKVESLLGALCPPPAALAGEPVTAPLRLVDRHGTSHSRQGHFLPIPAGGVAGTEDEPPRVLGILLPVPAPIRFSAPAAAQELHAELAAVKQQLRRRYDLAGWVATTPASKRVVTQLTLARDSDCPVLLVGERGTGKEHAARIIHYQGPHRLKTFVPLDCRVLPAREVTQTVRRFFTAEEGDPQIPILQPGTLFLRNVDRLPRELQEFLAGEFEAGPRADGRRIMASLSRPRTEIEELFVPEFWGLISALTIELPPLRLRAEEVGPQAQAFLEESNRGSDLQLGGFSNDVLHEFRRYNWPGNVGELAEVVRGCREAARGPTIAVSDLPFRFRTGMDAQRLHPARGGAIVPLDRFLEEAEAEQIRAALEEARGNKSIAAGLLQIPRAKLYRRMEALGLATDDPQPASGEDGIES